MSDTWRKILAAGRVLVLDGGTGSELRRRGVALDRAAWSAFAPLTHFDVLRAIHSDFVAAGADVITTSTFATTRFVLDAAGHGADFAAINARAVAATREARGASGRDVAIAGSISCLPPRFDARAYPDPDAERDAYRELADLLAEQGVDLLALEMLEDDVHAARACEAAAATGLPVWLGVSGRLGRDGALAAYDFPERPLSAVLDALLPLTPDAVNVMHSPPGAVAPALELVRARFRGIVGAYPELEDDALAPGELAALARGWIAGGARIVGGCCGTTPEHVAALRAAVDECAPPT